jgi:hypothetical protein
LLLQAAFLQLLLFVSIPKLNKCMKKQSCFGHTSFPLKGFFFCPGGSSVLLFAESLGWEVRRIEKTCSWICSIISAGCWRLGTRLFWESSKGFGSFSTHSDSEEAGSGWSSAELLFPPFFEVLGAYNCLPRSASWLLLSNQ